jgi:uncharacterized oligopeptide transporter (OPT) family protein
VNSTNGQVVLVVVAVVAGVGVLAAFRSGARSAYRVARHTQQVTRMGGNLTRALASAVVIVGVQWAVVSVTTDPRTWGVALGVPALFAGSAIARMFAVTELAHDSYSRRGHRR